MTAAQCQITSALAYQCSVSCIERGWFIAAKTYQTTSAHYAKQARILMGLDV
jgi:hypothetical protein